VYHIFKRTVLRKLKKQLKMNLQKKLFPFSDAITSMLTFNYFDLLHKFLEICIILAVYAHAVSDISCKISIVFKIPICIYVILKFAMPLFLNYAMGVKIFLLNYPCSIVLLQFYA
jgi:hypothetical protein